MDIKLPGRDERRAMFHSFFINEHVIVGSAN